MPNVYLISALFFISISCYGQKGKMAPLQMESIGDYYIQNWTTEDGLTQNSVNDIIQTQDGYLWLATYGGLVRYDGVNFETYTIGNTPGLASNRIITLLETDSGSVWIGHREGGLSILEDGIFHKPKVLEDISKEFVLDFCEDLDGNVWIATGDGLYKYLEGQLDQYHIAEGLPGSIVRRLFLHNSGAVHFITDMEDQPGFAHGYILEGKIKVLKKYPTSERVNILDYNSKGELWMAYPDRVVMEKEGKVLKSFEFGKVDLGEVHTFLIDREGNMWLGSQQHLVMITREEAQNAQNGPVELQRIYTYKRENDINRITQDREGNIWVGTWKEGLFMFKKRVIKRYFPSTKNASSIYTKVAPDGHGGIWFSAACHDLTHYINGKFSQYETFDGCVRALYNDPKDEAIIYVGVESELGKIEDFRYEKLGDIQESLNVNPYYMKITAIQKADDGAFWLGTTGNGLVVFKDTVVHHFTSSGELTGDVILTIKKTSDGDIWVGTNAGITIFSADGIKKITAEDGLVRGDIRSIFEDRDGVIWVGSYGAGLSRIEDGQITSYTASDGLLENIVSRITEDVNGNLWMIGNMGLFMLDKQQFNDLDANRIAQLTCISFELEDGMIEGNGAGQVAKTADGLTWWPTIKGMAAINIDDDYEDPIPTNTLIQKVVISDVVYTGPIGQCVTLENQRDIAVTYAGLKFSNPTKIKYRYKLEGYDKDWKENGIKRTLNYTNLNPGNYLLKIEASNLNGAWGGEPATLAITVVPTIWEMTWTKIIAVIILLFLIWLLFRWRNLYLIKKREELSSIVKMRTKELHEKNQELEATLSNLKVTHDKLVQSEKMASLGTMIAGVSHEINNPLQFIQNGLDILKKSRHDLDGVKEHLDPSLEIIDNGIKRASEIVQSLNQFARSNENYDEQFDLREVLDNCLVILRNRLNAKASVEVKISDEKLLCHGNQGKLHQAFLNLLSNAEQAIDETGKITIEAKKLADKIEVAISDTGHGISPEIISKIFDPFFTTKPPGKGTGLGLSITYEIIDQHKGSIDIKSDPGKGSTFTVSLPIS
ncbi:MAG: two-component regulator propeller domain-containing protein [Cyclobacteriaceae bacterium]